MLAISEFAIPCGMATIPAVSPLTRSYRKSSDLYLQFTVSLKAIPFQKADDWERPVDRAATAGRFIRFQCLLWLDWLYGDLDVVILL